MTVEQRFKYIVLNEDGDVIGGTNDEDLKNRIVFETDCLVVYTERPMKELSDEDFGFDSEEEDEEEAEDE